MYVFTAIAGMPVLIAAAARMTSDWRRMGIVLFKWEKARNMLRFKPGGGGSSPPMRNRMNRHAEIFQPARTSEVFL